MELEEVDDEVEERCPVCGSEEYDGYECYECMFLKCPICEKVVHDFGEVGELNPCEHVLAWGTIGNEDVHWIDREHEKMYNEFCEGIEDGEEILTSVTDLVEEYANRQGLDYVVHSDEAGHGHSRAMFLVFSGSKHA